MRRKLSPAILVQSLTAALVIIIFATLGLLIWQGYGRSVQQAVERAETGAEVVAEETRWLVGSSLRALGGAQVALGGDPAAFTPAVRDQLTQDLNVLPATVTLSIYDATGHIVSPVASPPLPADISKSSLLAQLAAGKTWIISPGANDVGEADPAFIVAQGLTRNGQFSGVAVLTVGVDVLGNFWAPLRLGPDATVSMVKDDGWMVARYPALAAPLNIANLKTFQDHLQTASSGNYVAVSTVDGVSRYIAFQHIPEFGLIAIASVSQNATLGAFWYGVGIVLLLMLPIALALILGSLWTARILRRLQHAIDHNSVLLREIHHRVKNNLQSISSLVQLQKMDGQAKADIIGRIDAMSAVHEHLYRTDQFERVDVRDYLHAIVDGIRRSHPTDVVVSENLQPLTVDKDIAMPLGLVINEVVTNAYKHAFSDGRPGAITINLTALDGDRGELVIADNGVGFDSAIPGKGIGRRLITGFTNQIQGESNFANDGGSRFTLRFPLDPQL